MLTGVVAWSLCLTWRFALSEEPPRQTTWAEIRIVDADSGRGVPLVELETVNGLRWVSDNAGRVAFAEPGLLDQEVFFFVRSHGYEVPRDGFGYAGQRVVPRVGQPVEIRIQRTQRAERLARLTGEGLYRDSIMLGHRPAVDPQTPRGMVAGQDSIQAAIYRNQIYCFWGDTQQMKYPLGLFRTAGATLPLPTKGSAPATDVPYQYFVDPRTQFARAMIPWPERPEGVIWIDGVMVLPDEEGRERLLAHFSRRRGLEEELDQGIALFDDERQVFEIVRELPITEVWRKPQGHAIHYREGEDAWVLFGNPAPNVRVRATVEAALDPAKYEAFTCLLPGDAPEEKRIDRQPDGSLRWRWQRELPPVGSADEARWVESGAIAARQARFLPADQEHPEVRVRLHSGTVRWNAHRKAWLMIAGQIGGKASFLGEVWLAQAAAPTGPFRQAVRVATHQRQSFYNVCHHAFWDADDGRVIHFEGTYTNDFSGNPDKTPRYNYNQILYRLDLERCELRAE